MRALRVTPGTAGSTDLDDMPEPPAKDGPVLVQTLAVGVCGTDLEIVGGDYGEAAARARRLVLGHESLGRVLEAPAGMRPVAPATWSSGIVRRPDPVPCPNCAVGEWDMCRNGLYTERGIKELDGYCSRALPARAGVRGQGRPGAGRARRAAGAGERPGQGVGADRADRPPRRTGEPRRALVTGAGPIGLLAALMGVQRGLEVHVLDRVTDGPKPDWSATSAPRTTPARSRDVGPRRRTSSSSAPASAARPRRRCEHRAGRHRLPDRRVVGRADHCRSTSARLNRDMVLENDVVFGSVNANRRALRGGCGGAGPGRRDWLARLITRRVPLERWSEAMVPPARRRESGDRVGRLA